MKRTLKFLLLLGTLCWGGTQSTLPLERYLLVGTLDGQKLHLDVTFTRGGEASGRLVQGRGERTLKGRADQEEVSLRTPNGALRLQGAPPTPFSDATPFSGTWTPPGTSRGKRARTFSLTYAAEYVTKGTRQGTFIELESRYPFFTAPPWRRVNGAVQKVARRPTVDFLHEGQVLAASGELSYFWTRYETFEVRHYTPKLLSLLSTVSVYTGGAHPNTFFRAFNFLQQGEAGVRRLELRELFKPGTPFVRVLSDYILDELREQKAAWVVDGSVADLGEGEFGVFTLSGRGLEFAFAPYAVGPYAQGAFFVTVPYARLEALLKPRFSP